MSQHFANELGRAQARPDIGEIITLVETHRRWNAMSGKEQERFLATNDVLDGYFRLDCDPDRAMAFVAVSASKYDDPEYLALMAAGPLEDILNPGITAAMIERVVAEARRTPRFRWMLAHVFAHAVDPAIRPLVEAAQMDITNEMPVPPAPWA